MKVSWVRGNPRIIQVMDDHLSLETYGSGIPHFKVGHHLNDIGSSMYCTYLYTGCVNYSDFTMISLESWLIGEIIPQIALTSGQCKIVIYYAQICEFVLYDRHDPTIYHKWS